MPPKKMLQYQCDRCPSVWYSEESKPEPPCAIEVKADFGDGGSALRAKFECLCPSCRQTVHALVKQISRTLQKASSIRVAKKKVNGVGAETADKASASSADPTKPSTPVASQISALTEASTPVRQTPSVPAPAATGAAAGKPPQVIAPHPKR